MSVKSYITIVIACLSSIIVKSQSFDVLPLGYVENIGQFQTTNGEQLKDLAYLLKLGNGLQMQLRRDGFSYDAFSAADESGLVTINRMDIQWLNGNSQPCIEAHKPASDLLHYPTLSIRAREACSSTRQNKPQVDQTAQHYQRVVYREIYPYVDIEFVVNPFEKILNEYNFILQKGARLSDILLEYRGASLLSIQDSILVFKLGDATLTEHLPHSFHLSTGRAINVQYCEEYTTNGSLVIGFQSHEDIITEPLVIDPIPHLDWATYYGGAAREDLKDVAVDNQGHVYAVGHTSSNTNIASSGAYQSIFAGQEDALLLKFTTEGERVWSTYFGGNEQEQARGLRVGASGDLFVIITTGSEFGITTPDTDQPDFGGGFLDGLLAKFTADGQLIWSTYLGGNSNDHVFAIDVNDNDEIYVAGRTKSFDRIATAGSFQQNISGDIDAFLMKYDGNGQRIWGTYFGGSRVDIASNLEVTNNGEVILSGWTASEENFSTSGTHQATYGGGQSDMFMAKFTPQGNRSWCSYFGGVNNDYANALTLDPQGHIIIGGSSFSPDNIGTSGTHQVISDGSGDAVLAKFTSNGQQIWGTYYGGENGDVISDIATDSAANIYAVGYTKSLENIATGGSAQNTHHGGIWDAMLIKFTPEGQRNWGTYYGGPEADQGFGLAINNDRQIFISGITKSSTNIATTSTYQTNYGEGDGDAFLARFSDCVPPLIELLNGGLICDDFPSQLQLRVSNPGCVTLNYSLDGVVQPPINIVDSLFELQLPASLQDSVNILSVNSGDCLGNIEGPNFIRRSTSLIASPVYRDCDDNNSTYRVLFSMSGGSGDYYELDNRGEFDTNVFESDPIPYGNPFSFRISSTDSCATIIINGFFNCTDVCPELGIELVGELAYCLGDDLTLSTSFGDHFRWSGPLGFAANGQAISIESLTSAHAGDYQLIVGHTFACHDTILFEIEVHQAPSLAITPLSDLSCASPTTDLLINSTGDGPLTFSLNNSPYQSGPTFRQVGPGVHTIAVKDDIGCEQTTEFTLILPTGPEIIAINQLPAPCNAEEGEIQVIAQGNGPMQYALNGGRLQNNPSFTNLPAGNYTLDIIDMEACTTSSLVSIDSEDCPIYIPSAFSPNLDGQHDLFRAFPPSGLDGQVMSYQIFDRWGGLIYTASDFPLSGPEGWWDGSTPETGDAEKGVYIYLIHIDLNNGERRIEKGSIMLIR